MVEQLSVFLQNESGRLSQAVRALSDGGIDIRALSIADTADFGILRLLVSDTAAAEKILVGHGYAVCVSEVVVTAVPDRPGGLAQALDLLAENGIDIEYMYSLIARDAEYAYMVFRVPDCERTGGLLARHGFEIVPAGRLGIKQKQNGGTGSCRN